MEKKYKILIYIGAGIMFAFLVYLIFRGLQGGSGNTWNPNSGNGQSGIVATSSLPSYMLNPEEEQKVYEFVKNFSELYNTYSYSDYSNLIALGDYQTPEMQQKTLEYVNILGKKIQPGYLQESKIIGNSFGYDYPTSDRLVVHLSLLEKRYGNFYPKIGEAVSLRESFTPELEGEDNILVEAELVKNGDGWLVSNFQIK